MINRIGPSSERSVAEGAGAIASSPDGITRFFTIAEVADLIQVTPRSVRRWISTGQLAVHRFGGIVRIAETDLAAFLDLHRRQRSLSHKL